MNDQSLPTILRRQIITIHLHVYRVSSFVIDFYKVGDIDFYCSADFIISYMHECYVHVLWRSSNITEL